LLCGTNIKANMTIGSLPKTMRAAVIHRFGGIEEIVLQDVPVPTVGPADVLLRVEAIGVGSWDAVEREGQYDGAFGFESSFPYVLGWDGAGTVAAVGESVTRFAVGDRVCAASMPLPRGGFYAEYAVVEEDYVFRVPPSLPIEQAAALPWDALTAQSGLELLQLAAGSTLMVIGASGGIGHFGVQMSKRMGARVLAVASGDDGVNLARRLGADAVVDGRRGDVVAAARSFAPEGIDAALVTVGGDAIDQMLAALRTSARVACPYGVLPQPRVSPDKELILYNGDRSQAGTKKLSQLINTGPLEVHLAQVFTLDQAAAAHRTLAEHYVGKLAMRVAHTETGRG
jgi:NADPH:quinone reductase